MPGYRLADYLEQSGRTERAGVYPPNSLWHAFTTTVSDPELLRHLANQAQERGRFQHAAWLYTQAAIRGDTAVLWNLAMLREKAGDAADAEALALRAADRGDTGALRELALIREQARDAPVPRPCCGGRGYHFGRLLRDAKPSTRTGRAAALTVYFDFLELRHKVEIYNLTGRVVECPLDEMNRPRASVEPQLRVPPAAAEIEAGAADQRRRPEYALVHRGCLGSVRRRPCPARCPTVSVGAQVPGRLRRSGHRGRVPAGPGGRGRGAPAGLGRQAHPARAPALLRVAVVSVGHEPVRHSGAAWALPDWNHSTVYPRSRHSCRGRLDHRATACRRAMEGIGPMKWNLRLAAANRGIWKASELQRQLAERGMTISAGKMSGLWSGQPNAIKLDELDVICAVLGCGVDELLLPEPQTVPQPAATGHEQQVAVGEVRTIKPRPRTGRSLPPR